MPELNFEEMSPQEVERVLDQLLQSPGGLQKIAQQMLSPLKRDLLYEGRARQLLQTYKLALGEEAVFDADVDIPAAAISIEGLPYELEVRADRIRIETAPIAVRPLVRWTESNFRKYDILNRTQERAKASIQLQEDLRAYRVIDFAAELGPGGANYRYQAPVESLAGTTAETNYPTKIETPAGTGRLTMEYLVEGIVTLRSKLLVASKILINPIRGKDILLFNTIAQGGGAGIFAPNFQEQLLKAGRIGSIWGVEIIESVVVPPDKVYVLAPADYLGVIAVRTDISVETLKDPNQMADVFAIWEDVGFCVRYAKGIVKIVIK